MILSNQVEEVLRTGLEGKEVLTATKILCPGVVTGRVVRVIDPYGVKLEREDDLPLVIVTESTDPGWTAFLGGLKKGDVLVTEVGGVLSHEAVAAAGFGFGVAYGVDGATEILRNGQIVKIDPRVGEISIVEDSENTKRRIGI